jgi:DNA recombination protein RmuC
MIIGLAAVTLLVVLLALVLLELRRLARATGMVQLEGRVEALTQQLGARMHETSSAANQLTSLVQNQLQDANRSLNSLTERMARMDETTRNLERLGHSIVGLEQILASPRLRGSLGEVSLERLLADVLPAQHIVRQHRLASRGVIVDCCIRAADGRLVPIDSKFPVEAFRRLLEAENRQDTDQANGSDARRRELHRSVRGRVDEIADKYICPEDGTLDFALMFVPSESLYYELAVRSGGELVDYARGRRVVLCSPNTLYAYLQAVLIGVRGVEIARRAQEIHATLEHLRQELHSAAAHFDRAGAQVRFAAQNLEAGKVVLDRSDERLNRALSAERDTEQPDALPNKSVAPPTISA